MAGCSLIFDDAPKESSLKDQYNEQIKYYTNIKITEVKNLNCRTESSKGDDMRLYFCNADLSLSNGRSVQDDFTAVYFTGRGGVANLDDSNLVLYFKKRQTEEEHTRALQELEKKNKADEENRRKELELTRAAEEASFKADQADAPHLDISEHPQYSSQEQPQDNVQQTQDVSQEQPKENKQEQSQKNNQGQPKNEGNEQR